jgi:hypothetical protein
MTDKADKAKKAKKSAKGQPSVLGSLPATRPDRLGRRGSSAGVKPATKPAAARSAAASKPPRARPAATRPTAASKAAASEKALAAERAAARRAAAQSAAAPPRPQPAAEEPRRKSGPPTGPEIVTTAVQAAGELAQIGITVGGQMLKRAVRRFPRP